jgi:hypothetical protein
MTKLEALRRIAEGLGELADFEALERQGQHQEIDQRYLHLLLDELGEGGRFSIEDRAQTASAHLAGTGRMTARPRVWSEAFLNQLRDLLVAEGLSVDSAYKVMRKLFPGRYSRDEDVRPASEQFPPPKRGRKSKR